MKVASCRTLCIRPASLSTLPTLSVSCLPVGTLTPNASAGQDCKGVTEATPYASHPFDYYTQVRQRLAFSSSASLVVLTASWGRYCQITPTVLSRA